MPYSKCILVKRGFKCAVIFTSYYNETMDFSLTPKLEELRKRTRSFIHDQIIPLEKDPRQNEHGPSEELRKDLIELARKAGLLTPHASIEMGGLGLSLSLIHISEPTRPY